MPIVIRPLPRPSTLLGREIRRGWHGAPAVRLFSADDDGRQHRAETTLAEFPSGFRNTEVVLRDSKSAQFEGQAVYRVQGTNTYLLMMGAIGSNGMRCYRSFTAQGLDGQ